MTDSGSEEVRPSIHQLVLEGIVGRFSGPVLQNGLRSMYVEEQIGVLLGEGWLSTGADWAGWDFETVPTGCDHQVVRLEVKQAAARQSWPQPKGPSRIRSTSQPVCGITMVGQ